MGRRAPLSWRRREAQEALPDLPDIAGILQQLHSARQPVDRLFVPMPSDDVAVGLELGGPFAGEATFDVGPSQEDDDHVLVTRLVGVPPEVGQAHLGLEGEV